MRHTYYMVYANDGSPVSTELGTLKQARQELKDIIKEDKEEFGLDEGDIDYYIVKVVEYANRSTEEIIR